MVIVTTAVYGALYRLNSIFSFPHWAGRREYKNLFKVSLPYVFAKQSSTTDVLNSSFAFKLYLSIHSPEVTESFCRIPLDELVRGLSLFSQRTCVGFRYGKLLLIKTFHCIKDSSIFKEMSYHNDVLFPLFFKTNLLIKSLVIFNRIFII